jgi:hypothetical protein
MKTSIILPVRILFSLKKSSTALIIFLLLAASTAKAGVHNFYFDVSLSKGQALLKWQTADEQNSRDFLVQYSTDGIHWVNIDSVKAAETSISLKNYAYTHTGLATGINYYRLEQRDIDGPHTFSKIASLLYKSLIKEFTVFPNPVVNNHLNVYLPQAAVVTLYNNAGAMVLQQQFSCGTQQMNVTSLPKGVYNLRAGNEARKFIVE